MDVRIKMTKAVLFCCRVNLQGKTQLDLSVPFCLVVLMLHTAIPWCQCDRFHWQDALVKHSNCLLQRRPLQLLSASQQFLPCCILQQSSMMSSLCCLSSEKSKISCGFGLHVPCRIRVIILMWHILQIFCKWALFPGWDLRVRGKQRFSWEWVSMWRKGKTSLVIDTKLLHGREHLVWSIWFSEKKGNDYLKKLPQPAHKTHPCCTLLCGSSLQHCLGQNQLKSCPVWMRHPKFWNHLWVQKVCFVCGQLRCHRTNRCMTVSST